MTRKTSTKLTFTDPALVVAFHQTPDGAVAEFNAFGDLTQPEAVAMLRIAANKLEEAATARTIAADARALIRTEAGE